MIKLKHLLTEQYGLEDGSPEQLAYKKSISDIELEYYSSHGAKLPYTTLSANMYGPGKPGRLDVTHQFTGDHQQVLQQLADDNADLLVTWKNPDVQITKAKVQIFKQSKPISTQGTTTPSDGYAHLHVQPANVKVDQADRSITIPLWSLKEQGVDDSILIGFSLKGMVTDNTKEAGYQDIFHTFQLRDKNTGSYTSTYKYNK